MAAHPPSPSPITSPDFVALLSGSLGAGREPISHRRRLRLRRRGSSQLPVSLCWLGSPLASSEFENTWREKGSSLIGFGSSIVGGVSSSRNYETTIIIMIKFGSLWSKGC